ncbi:septum formation protein [Candidatus Kinetoplastibacterium desouzaii TCC079E]|uniref:7-methyl-GTP pyrophosphatase n=1 Tax=Candidatus Kinetoplastidibacterium desouzai TCC079E TaxID=1208919 RepID=M1LSA2_9PROT|nr:Maf family nucleotide pyrophosphatase [Candidatus Kinetoplastibacterium desouzaii]AGF47016.1 septum formation protein [Candidatus Kinetoplastibacterium desouzaii TCC079E]
MNNNCHNMILASSSKYRKELLSRLNIPFSCISPDIDETPLQNESPEKTSLRLAVYKAKEVHKNNPNKIVIGSDQIAGYSNYHIGKPGNFSCAKKQLEFMSGKNIVFYSSVAVINGSNIKKGLTITNCKFKKLDHITINRYLEIEKPFDVAGSSKSEGLGIALLESMYSEDPTAILGMPMIKLINILSNFGINPLKQ